MTGIISYLHMVTFVEIMWTEITGEMVSHQLAAHSEVLN